MIFWKEIRSKGLAWGKQELVLKVLFIPFFLSFSTIFFKEKRKEKGLRMVEILEFDELKQGKKSWASIKFQFSPLLTPTNWGFFLEFKLKKES